MAAARLNGVIDTHIVGLEKRRAIHPIETLVLPPAHRGTGRAHTAAVDVLTEPALSAVDGPAARTPVETR